MPPAKQQAGREGMPTEPPTFGCLVVGIGGNNGVTMLAGLRANQLGLEWESPVGKVMANYYGCITQLPVKGGKGGYREQYPLADANRCAVGGWDIRDTPLGDALYQSHVLDFDLVRQVREPLNSGVAIMKGVWDPSFIGESQHATATHVVPHEATTHAQALQILRRDIQRFRWEQGVQGHITVIWSASVERPCMKDFDTADALLAAIENNDPEVSPSLLYATAACLEGCSFVNGGSQNTLCPALEELARQNKCYVLGTDFKAGQTKFKTAAVEYIRALGLKPTVIASSNHLGNNDMLNLTSKKTLDAKMRVKSDIFAGWGEQIDHQVRVMYTPFIGDEKRDIVEYTSLGFLGCPHTMVTYTRCMDSILCVPLMVDAAVWCDYFARVAVPQDQAAMATAYLFKVPEGAAKGVDPGFFHQMDLLEKVLEASLSPTHALPAAVQKVLARQQGQQSATSATSEEEPPALLGGSVVCVGLSCLDLMLVGASGEGEAFGAINTFQEQVFCPGGSAPQSSLALAEMAAPVKVLTKVGRDVHGEELLRQLEAAGVDTSLVIRDPAQATSLAVLPILASSGARGCFVNLRANDAFTPHDALAALETPTALDGVAAVHFGYPHLMKHFRGQGLRDFIAGVHALVQQQRGKARAEQSQGGAAARRTVLVSMDLNGVTAENREDAVLAEALPLVDVLHLNEDEARLLTGVELDKSGSLSPPSLQQTAESLLHRGVGVVAITLGEQGAFVKVTGNEGRLQQAEHLAWQAGKWAGAEARLLPYPLQDGAEANTNGAGDAFVAGLVAAVLCRGQALSLRQATAFAMLTARERVDSLRRASPTKASYQELLQEALRLETS